AGRWYPSATEIALEHDIPVGCVDINAPRVVEAFQREPVDLIVVAYYDQILQKPVIEAPHLGCINLHLALPEDYRGCYPTTHALINNEPRHGACIHWIDEGVDTGDIIAQETINVRPEDTGRTLYDRISDAGIRLFWDTFPAILDGTANRTPQVTTENTKSHRREFPSHEIELDDATKHYIRALTFPPFPPPFVMIGGKKFVIVEADSD
ncbi:unnamed protein product, partial [marine sediment metagenome]